MKVPVNVNVILWGDVIGRLSWDEIKQVSTFQFSEKYHQMEYNLQPTRPTKPIPAFLGEAGDKYHGLPPFLADSLPDNWGSLIFDRWAKENGIQPRDCNPLLKLAYIGKRGIGAFEFEPDFQSEDDISSTLSSLESLAQKTYRERSEIIISDDAKKDFDTLARLGSPPGGAHSKILVAISDTDDSLISGQACPKAGFTQYILKFKEDYDVPSCEIEYIYYLMAKEAGITMMPSRLKSINGYNHFLTQRFDRKAGNKLLTMTMAAMIPGATDYQNLFFLCRTLKLTEKERSELFRRMCFNVVAGNTDDHNKNFSFIMYPDGHWELAPAYDVTFTADIWNNSDDGIHSLGILSKRCYFSAEDLLSFGRDFDIAETNGILDEVCRAVSRFRELAECHNIPSRWIENISKVHYEIFPDRDLTKLG